MAKIPDFGGLTKKLDIQGLVDSVKSAVASVSAPPKAPEGDEVAARFVGLMSSIQNLANLHAEQARLLQEVNSKLNGVYKDIQTLRGIAAATPTASTTPPPQAGLDDDDKIS